MISSDIQSSESPYDQLQHRSPAIISRISYNMGHSESKVATKSRFNLVELEKSTTEIRFDPDQSRAVCAGVGRHLNMRHQLSDVPTCDQDARLMFETLTKTLRIPQKHVTVLRSLSKHRYPATACNIEDSLKSAAENTGPGGILLFYFSGLVIGYEGGNKKALIPADYAGVNSTVMTIDRIVASLTSLKNTDKQIVVILDCCSAARVAKQLNTIMGTTGYKVCAIAACSDAESAYTFASLQASFFTFFLHHFLTKTPPRKCLPLKAICDYCGPVCGALASLVQHDGQPSDSSMHPTIISVLRIETVDTTLIVRPVLDETDGSVASGDRFAKTLGLLQYQSKEDFTVDMNWSKEVCKWMQTKAPSLWVYVLNTKQFSLD